ncbi:MAG: hypothetical protein ACK5LP_07255 [Campylobacteraceae bacterium]
MQDYEQIIKDELQELFKIREEIFKIFGDHIPTNGSEFMFDFSSKPKIDAEVMYKLFYKYDYQARKVFGNTFNLMNSKK